MDTLLNWSGGIDSTLVMYEYLKANPKTTLLVHHCHIRNYQGRDEMEARAIERIQAWFSAHGLTNYELIETVFDYGSLPSCIHDHELCAMWSGIIVRHVGVVRRYRGLRRVLIPFIDVEQHTFNRDGIWREVFNAFVGNKTWSQRQGVQLEYPIIGLKKDRIIRRLPADLLARTWWCRTPNGDQWCRECHACRLVIPSLPIPEHHFALQKSD